TLSRYLAEYFKSKFKSWAVPGSFSAPEVFTFKLIAKQRRRSVSPEPSISPVPAFHTPPKVQLRDESPGQARKSRLLFEEMEQICQGAAASQVVDIEAMQQGLKQTDELMGKLQIALKLDLVDSFNQAIKQSQNSPRRHSGPNDQQGPLGSRPQPNRRVVSNPDSFLGLRHTDITDSVADQKSNETMSPRTPARRSTRKIGLAWKCTMYIQEHHRTLPYLYSHQCKDRDFMNWLGKELLALSESDCPRDERKASRLPLSNAMIRGRLLFHRGNHATRALGKQTTSSMPHCRCPRSTSEAAGLTQVQERQTSRPIQVDRERRDEKKIRPSIE
ncbi:hypothetical protein CVT26_010265, partial [Gymnopilus dilepis]